MDAYDFAKGFERPPRSDELLSSDKRKKLRPTLLSPATKWSHFFSGLVTAHLTASQEDPQRTLSMLRLYEDDAMQHLLQNIVSYSQDRAFHHPRTSSTLNALNFHTLNQGAMPYWHRLAAPGEVAAPDYIDLSVMQTKLAIQGMKLVSARERFRELAYTPTPWLRETGAEFDASFVGRITEVDAGIALLEMLKQQPADDRESLVVIPAPPKFESDTDKASDFLLLDIAQHQALGIQTKTRLQENGKYDPDYVSFIDGVADLDNIRTYQLPSGSTRSRTTPGLVAADFIINNEAVRFPQQFSQIEGLSGLTGQVLRAQQIAEKELQAHPLKSDRVGSAAKKIGERLLDDLRYRPSDEDDAYKDEDKPDNESSLYE